jgi:phosphatidylglycerophosphate synthase
VGKRAHVAVSSLGKIKTAVQMLAIIVLLYCNRSTNPTLIFTGITLLYISALLTIWSMLLYLQAAWHALRINN